MVSKPGEVFRRPDKLLGRLEMGSDCFEMAKVVKWTVSVLIETKSPELFLQICVMYHLQKMRAIEVYIEKTRKGGIVTLMI